MFVFVERFAKVKVVKGADNAQSRHHQHRHFGVQRESPLNGNFRSSSTGRNWTMQTVADDSLRPVAEVRPSAKRSFKSS